MTMKGRMTMKNPEPDDRAVKAQRRARIERLLLAGAAFGTAVGIVGTAASPKLPPFVGE
jgi:hypothetical protein